MITPKIASTENSKTTGIKKFTILYVDDEDSNLNIFKNTFRREYQVYTASSAKEGLKILEDIQVDLILTDQRMPEMTGVDFLKQALVKYPDLNRILITAFTEFDALKNAVNEAQIFQYIQKPWTEDNLRKVIEQALDVYKLKKENEMLNIELKEKNVELERLNKELLDLDKIKSDFLSIISHEIRTPLNGLIGPLELLKTELTSEKSEKIKQLLDILEVSVDRLENFALSAERVTVLKANKYQVIPTQVNLLAIVNETKKLLKEKIATRKVSIKTRYNHNETFSADAELIRIAIREVLDNAIKYSPSEGIVTISSVTKNNNIEISFTDEGKGFPQKILKNPFQLFLTGGYHTEKTIGIDLSLVKLIMDVHNGKIELSNNNDKGAHVKLILPLS